MAGMQQELKDLQEKMEVVIQVTSCCWCTITVINMQFFIRYAVMLAGKGFTLNL